ncbi:MAG: tRNA (cytidine(34)-2'-O)-methyltransferase [Pigmentiphaga sp.]
MFHIILVSPEIPPNTGNVIRLAANTGVQLHLVRPLGFELDEPRLRRAGLDYHEWASVRVHDHLDAALAATSTEFVRTFALTTRGASLLGEVPFRPGDVFVFGSETAGLAPEVRDRFPAGQRIRLPMRPGQRSLNLSNAVAVTVFEAWRQQGYAGGA